MKKYKAIFFDWDGTAVKDRFAPVDEAVACMAPLLEAGIVLIVISGTTYGNIGGGDIEKRFTPGQLGNLYFGLGRGSFNFGFDQNGKQTDIASPDIAKNTVLKIHETAFAVHQALLSEYGYQTDIIFSRPNYVKIDIMNDAIRAANQYLSANEIDLLKARLIKHRFSGGIAGLIELAQNEGSKRGLKIKATCDAKFLEVGILNKSDNVNTLIERVIRTRAIAIEDCCFWGDEYLELDDGITGSDSFMHTPMSQGADFFDVGTIEKPRPAYLKHVGGSTVTFLEFLKQQRIL